MTQELYFTLRHVHAQRDKANLHVFPSPKTKAQRVKFQPIIKEGVRGSWCFLLLGAMPTTLCGDETPENGISGGGDPTHLGAFQ